MDPTQFPSNSNEKTNPPREKKVERLTTGVVGRRKTPLGKRFLETFIVGNTQSVAQYVVRDVIVPTLKDVITEIVQTSVERMLFGDSTRSGRRPGSSSTRTHTPYNRYSQQPSSGYSSRVRPAPVERRTSDYDDIVVGTLAEANDVMDKMFELMERYNQVTLRDLYDMVGIESNHAHECWGWNDIRGMQVTRVRGGYLLDLTRPIALD